MKIVNCVINDDEQQVTSTCCSDCLSKRGWISLSRSWERELPIVAEQTLASGHLTSAYFKGILILTADASSSVVRYLLPSFPLLLWLLTTISCNTLSSTGPFLTAAIAYFAFDARLFCRKQGIDLIENRTLVADVVVAGVRETPKVGREDSCRRGSLAPGFGNCI